MRAVPAAPAPSSPSTPSCALAGEHYENFPVASWLCPPRLRPPIAAIYTFARTADDIADEGDATPDERLAQLSRYRAALARTARFARGEVPGMDEPEWPAVFAPLARAMAGFGLPEALLADLLSAFEQDVRRTRDASAYAGRAELLDYCARSANPVGRLLLHLYGVRSRQALLQSDAICTALQLINFWQDLSVDLPRARHYLSDADLAAHDLTRAQLNAFRPIADAAPPPAALALVAEMVAWARALMHEGAPLVHQLPGRAGWELRAVVQGGLCILDKIAAQGFDSFSRRPTVGKADLPRLAWRVLRM